jgi:AraC-like DNA-binding protein
LLVDERLTLTEVAFQTGYSEMSTFYRAFRRWTGQTPREYRDATVR